MKKICNFEYIAGILWNFYENSQVCRMDEMDVLQPETVTLEWKSLNYLPLNYQKCIH